jgi:hypothetical protein
MSIPRKENVTMVKTYIKKPIPVQAVQYDGLNLAECLNFLNGNHDFKDNCLVVKNEQGDMIVGTGDYIIKGVSGEYYPCKQDIFEATYTLAF